VILNDFFENIPDFNIAAFEHLLSALKRVRKIALLELPNDERLIKLERDRLRKTALVQKQARTDDDNASRRVVDALAKQVFAFD
jgi:hypothetical protein